ncbi:hypothetical protein EDC04DRAFT_2601067 [Pisolithus marmoratus]|nr:hypothetical protein EDC04DRAFT_2601067 [Pisolithus marmoratus]
MSHAYFPEDIPGEDILDKLMAKQRLVQGSTASRCIVEVQGKDGDMNEINIPRSYFNHMQCCMWRESATQVVLDHANQLGLWEDLTNILIKSGAFNSYLRIEYWVMSHEPWLIREFRHNNDMNINQCNVQELDWKAYDSKLGPISANDMQFLRTLHGHMKDFYDPIVAEDTDFGYTFKEHLLPVEELNQEEGGNQEGVGEQQDQDDALSEEGSYPGITQASICLQLAGDEARACADKNELPLHPDVTPSILISTGIDLEDQHSPQTCIKAWQKIQVLFMPGASTICDECTNDSVGKLQSPEDIALWLPSQLNGKVTCLHLLGIIEFQLREDKCSYSWVLHGISLIIYSWHSTGASWLAGWVKAGVGLVGFGRKPSVWSGARHVHVHTIGRRKFNCCSKKNSIYYSF